MRKRGLEQHIGADDIGVDELGRTIDRPVDVAFGGQMHDGVRIEVREDVSDAGAIADVGAAEAIPRMLLYCRKRGEIAGIGQLVDDQHLMIGL